MFDWLGLAFILLFPAIVVGMTYRHRTRWLAAHAGEPRITPVIAAFSPITGEAIATGTEPLADACHANAADNCHCGDASGHDGTNCS